ncbi:MAG: hypothetical protein K8Q91_03015 [Candidatus Vogelbacteria bacterium]|nr:hypothetical protein [Candidatus Vogelbacteria bacterium]
MYKPAGLTPLQTLDLLRQKFSEYKDKKLSYAGRLDPLAEGVMLVLVGESNFSRERYLGLPKVYEAEILLGVSTDTGDVMGLVTEYKLNEEVVLESRVREILAELVGIFEQKYPQFSSPKIAGRRRLEDNTLVSKQVEITRLDFVSLTEINGSDLLEKINSRIDKVVGDFRQTDIKSVWDKILSDRSDQVFSVIKIKVSASSGVYVRVLAEKIGRNLGVPALAYSIKRFSVGDYPIDTALKLE